MDNRHTQKCSMSLIITEMQIRATMSYNLTPVKVAIINKSTNNSVGEGVAKREPSCTVGWAVHWGSHYGKQHRDSSKNGKQNYNITQQFHFWAFT